jgi:hypothetical protein
MAKQSFGIPRAVKDSFSCQKGVSIIPTLKPSFSNTFLRIPSGKDG